LFVYNADRIAPLFVGAMCAVGTLNTSAFGFPALMVKMLVFFSASTWLVLHHLDTRGYDYPLTRLKYRMLLLIAPLVLTGAYLQIRFFLALDTDVITSCCGSLFSSGSKTLAGDIATLPPVPMEVAFYLSMGANAAAGLYFYLKNRGGYLFGGLSAAHFLISITAMLSFISPYFYELPTHHCPFCILQEEYGYIGYPLYLALFGSAVTGMGVGILMPFRDIESLARTLPAFQKKLALASLILALIFAGAVTYRLLFTDFVLQS
jgi:hypothetical protein